MNKNIEIIIRAIIINQGRILLCKNKGKNYYFFPGGHLEFGESIKTAIARELYEELGAKVKNCKFLDLVENIFVENKIKHHEINLVYIVDLQKIKSQSRESHLEFVWMDKKQFNKAAIKPAVLKNML